MSTWKKRGFVLFVFACVLLVTDGHCFAYTFTTIDTGGYTVAYGINDHGEIVGNYGDATGLHGYVYSQGVLTAIDVPGADVLYTNANAINNSGIIVGSYGGDASGTPHSFVYSNGIFTTLYPPGNHSIDQSFGINDSNSIVGTIGNQAYLYEGGMYTTFEFLGGAPTSAYGINNSNAIVGCYGAAGTYYGYVYEDGIFTTINVPGSLFTHAYGINDHHEIVGAYQDAIGVHGYVYSKGIFTTIDVPGAAYPGAGSGTVAVKINNKGDIVGAFYGENGWRGYEAHRVPEPSTILLLGAGLAGLAVARKRFKN